jgi:nucleoside-diphosphate-sugar epimerase
VEASLTEVSPLRRRLYPYRTDPRRPKDDPQAWMDDYDKIPIERAVAAAEGLDGAIVRMPMVYGPRDRQRRFAWAIRPMAAGAKVLEVDAAWADWRTSYGYLDDVAAGLALAAVHPAAAGRTFNLGPACAPDHRAWASRIAEALHWRGDILRVDRAAVVEPLKSRLDGLDLGVPLATDTSRIRRELGYAEVTEPAEALRRTIEDEISRP